MVEEKLISLDELIKRAKKKGVNFGKSDPYNRLRYYTKISLLPHMERRQTKKGVISAFYPESALDTLIKIETLKLKGVSNEEILSELERQSYSFSSFLKKNLSIKALGIALVLIVVITAFLNQSGLISLSKESNQSITDTTAKGNLSILASGTHTLKAGRKSTFVNAKEVTELSQIQITFTDSISPAETYTIENRIPQEGFILTLDNQTAQSSRFNWWILQK